MKRCRNRKYKNCNQSFPDEFNCCPECGGELVSDYEHSNTNIGDGNAISGGVHSSDDHSKKDSDNVVNSNNTTNNTTIYEAEKSESEKFKENSLTYRLKCQELFRDGIISREGECQLRELQIKLNLADELVRPIKEEAQQWSKKRKTQLSSTALSDIRQTKSIIEQNIASALQNQLDKLKSWMQEYDDNTLNLMYYQMSSMLEPVCYTNRYEDSVKDEYWEVYWAYIAYLLQNRRKQAYEALASLGRWHAYYPEQNDTILLLTGRLMRNEPIEDIRQARNQLTVHFTSDLQLLLDAIDELLQMDWDKEAISIRPTHSFYITTLFGHFVETQKAAGLQRLKERREQERIKREEEERIRQAELNLQNQIRSLKTSVLQKFQEIGKIEAACKEVGIDFHTFNVWLEEDPTFASSYNELVHEEAERKRKEEKIKQKKSQFKILFEQNKCDLLKTCSEVGISSADYQEWRRVDPVFNDDVNYIIRKNQEILDELYKQKRTKVIKKVGAIICILIILVVVALGAKAIIYNIEQKEKIDSQYQSLIDKFNDTSAEIDQTVKNSSYSPDVEKFNSTLNSLKERLEEIQRFESLNSSISNPQYTVLKQKTIDLCDTLLLNRFPNMITSQQSNRIYLQNSHKWENMRISVESLKISIESFKK